MEDPFESTTIMESYVNSSGLFSNQVPDISSTTEISFGESVNKTIQTIISTKDIVSRN